MLMKMNLLDVENGIIGHQVNCKGVMGIGLALDIRKKYPLVYTHYIRNTPSLGEVQFVCVSQSPLLYVANMAGQLSYGRTGVHTNYEALGKCLEEVHSFSIKHDLPIYLPFGIGCGYAGGNWYKVENLIKSKCPNAILCKL